MKRLRLMAPNAFTRDHHERALEIAVANEEREVAKAKACHKLALTRLRQYRRAKAKRDFPQPAEERT